jgi:hypothetical protein
MGMASLNRSGFKGIVTKSSEVTETVKYVVASAVEKT